MVIATTTPKGYKNNISKNPVMSSTFQKLTIDPPTQKECIDILNYMKPYYERYHHVKYYDGFVKDCVSLCNRYVTDRKLPTSALDIMDESGILKYMAVNSNVQIKGKTLELKRLVHLNEINKLNEKLITDYKRKVKTIKKKSAQKKRFEIQVFLLNLIIIV